MFVDPANTTKYLVNEFDEFIAKLNPDGDKGNMGSFASVLKETNKEGEGINNAQGSFTVPENNGSEWESAIKKGFYQDDVTPLMNEATPSSAQQKSFLNAVTSKNTQPKLNFRSLINKDVVVNSDCVLPVENVHAAQHKFANSLVGFFVGKKVAFQLVQNYVMNTWGKFGFQKVMRDDDNVYYFKFTSKMGLEQVLERGPWLIRNQPLILTRWSPNMNLSKDTVTKVPIWVKVHKVPVVAYSDDGLSLIATQIGKPVMLDAFTSSMCAEPWGRLGYARALIEVTDKRELKKEVTMAIPIINGEGHTLEKMNVEYEWQPPRCSECQVFGNATEQCPKRVKEPGTEHNHAQEDGFTKVQNRKKKGKQSTNNFSRPAEGIKVNKQNTFVWNPKNTKAGSLKQKNGETNIVNTNPYDVLQNDENCETSMGSGGNTADKNKVMNLYSDSDMENIYTETKTIKGASTPSNDVFNV
ncbi:hypothetical protein Tco_0378156 [Tanacetum coccineum]